MSRDSFYNHILMMMMMMMMMMMTMMLMTHLKLLAYYFWKAESSFSDKTKKFVRQLKNISGQKRDDQVTNLNLHHIRAIHRTRICLV